MSASEFEGHEALIAELRAGTLDAPDGLQRRVLEGRQSRRQRWAEMSRRRQALWLIPVAATLAVGAALVHGAFPGSNSTQAAPLTPRLAVTRVHGRVPASAKAAHKLNAVGAAGAVGWTGAQEMAPQAAANRALYSTADSATSLGTVQIPTHRHVHASASLQVVVPNNDALSNATHQATAIVTALGGYAQTVHQSTGTRDGSAFLDLRVPVGKANLAIEQLGKLGRIVSQQVSTKDLEQKYTRQVDTIGRLLRSIAVYKQALQSGSVSGYQRVEVQNRLTQAEYYLAQARKAHKNTVASAATTDIQLTLATNQHAFVAPAGKTGRLGRLLHNAAQFLALEGVIVLYVLIVAGPILILIGLAWWLARERRRRDEKHLLASA